jgi:hypothetical protein
MQTGRNKFRDALRGDDEPKPKEEKPITTADYFDLDKKLAQFPQKRIQGILVSPLDQWFLFTGVLKLEDGEWIVRDAFQYHYWLEIETRRQKYHAWLDKKNGIPKPKMPPRPEGLVKRMQ